MSKKEPREMFVLEINGDLDAREVFFLKENAEICKGNTEKFISTATSVKVIKFQEVGHRAAHHKKAGKK